MSTNETLTLTGKAVLNDTDADACIGDIKRVWVAGGLQLTGKATLGDADGCIGDVQRVWTPGGRVITGKATLGDTDGFLGDVKRVWQPGGLVLTGKAVLNDTDPNAAKGDILKIAFVTLQKMEDKHPIDLTIEAPPPVTLLRMQYKKKFITKVEYNSKTIWEMTPDEWFDYNVPDINGYVDVSNKKLVVRTTGYKMALCYVRGGCKYQVGLSMDVHFRICSYKEIPTIGMIVTALASDSLDNNHDSQDGATRTLTITVPETDKIIFIYYWKDTDNMTADEIKKTITVKNLTSPFLKQLEPYE